MEKLSPVKDKNGMTERIQDMLETLHNCLSEDRNRLKNLEEHLIGASPNKPIDPEDENRTQFGEGKLPLIARMISDCQDISKDIHDTILRLEREAGTN